jgi:D-alanine-D-alanine ligase
VQKKKVVILYGGRSVEHGVSVNSARNILEFLDPELFEPVPIGITPDGRWFLTSGVSREIEQGKALGLILDAQRPGFILLASDNRIKADLIFPVLHGTDGEDGSIQGLIKAMNIPMVGTGVAGSALAINKVTTKILLEANGIPTSKFVAFESHNRKAIKFEMLKEQFGLPFMVKAANLGSSVGVSKVKDKAQFKKAVDEAFRYDHTILIEQFIPGRELECAVLGNRPAVASLPGEIVVDKAKYEFYTFDAKYVDASAVSIEVPAKLKPELIKKIQDYSVRSFYALQCQDFARVDLFLSDKGRLYVNEINTIPGFTNSSMFPMLWAARGISFPTLITNLISLATERYEQHQQLSRDFQSGLKF